jgi:hypothetical protein
VTIEIDTASDHIDLFDRLMSFLQQGSTSGGPGWMLLRYDSSARSALFEAPGLSGTDEIRVGINWNASVVDDAYAIGFFMFRGYNEDLADDQQPGFSGYYYLPVWNTAMPYWFVANGQCVKVVAKVSTIYSAAYAGRYLPNGLPDEYTQPYFVGAPVLNPTVRWSTNDENHRNFWDPGEAARMLNPSGVWHPAQNFTDISGESEYSSPAQHVHPYAMGSTLAGAVRLRYRELRENLDGGYWLMPCILAGDAPVADEYGELDGVFAVNGFNNAAENTIDFDGASYLVVQNLFRTTRFHYAAIKLE